MAREEPEARPSLEDLLKREADRDAVLNEEDDDPVYQKGYDEGHKEGYLEAVAYLADFLSDSEAKRVQEALMDEYRENYPPEEE